MSDSEHKEPFLKAKPILFNTDMVRAILDGRKTVTRRVIKPQPLSRLAYIFGGYGCGKWGYPDKTAYKYWGEEFKQNIELSEKERKRLWTPPCHTDDILYVRETWAELETVNGVPYWAYKADDQTLHHSSGENFERWQPSIHMPKEATRIFLRVTNVRVERLQDITTAQIEREGIYQNKNFNNWYTVGDGNHSSVPKLCFRRLWDSTIKKSDLDKCGWAANPWVWVIEFERID